ncbi:hypothetical protein VNO80_35517 [Phaseolus coccineus]|uniref:Uncharacterized protein n=1 Tax=Phaseolus coccineus TaxID=3886 RepID=A0AAN9KQ79_PHACN
MAASSFITSFSSKSHSGFKFRLGERKTWRGQDSNLQSSDYEPDKLTNYSTPLLHLLFLLFHDSHLGPLPWLLGRDRTSAYLLTRVGSEILRDPITYEKVDEFISPLRERGDFVVIANEQAIRDRFTPRGAYTSRLSKFCSKTSSENLYREGFPAAQQFFHTNLAARRCYWHNNRRHPPQINYPPRSVPPPPEFSPLVLRIFTENSISPGPCRRQRGSRYTIRAGRYLCDKEFRYLRTVRVTAAVYRGFHSKLITLLLPTFQHRAGVRLYTSCYHLAESCVFNKQSLPPVHREDRPPNSKFFPGSFNLVDYDNSRDYKKTRDYGRAGDRARPSQKGFDDSSKVHIRERRVRGRGGSPRPDHPIHSNRQAWFCSQSNFVTFVYPSDGSPFGACIRSFPGVEFEHAAFYWEGSNHGNESTGLSPSLARSSNLFTITVHCALSMKGACWFFHHPIHKKSNETWRKRSEHFAAEEFIILERETKLRVCFSSNPNPLSLAATNGVSVDFPSFSY